MWEITRNWGSIVSAKAFFTHPLGILLSAVGTTFLWGSAFPFIKLSYTELEIGPTDLSEQLLVAGYRFVGASLLIMLFMLIVGRQVRYVRGTLPRIATIASTQTFFQYLFFYIGLSMSTGIQGSIISGTTSFFQIVIAYFLFRGDTITLRKALGMIIGFVGVIVANIGRGELVLHFGIGELLLLIAMFFGGLGNVLSKKGAMEMEITYMTSYQMLLGGIGLTVLGAFKVGIMPFHFTPLAIWLLVYLCFVSAVSFVLWNSVMKYNKVGQVSVYLFLIPVSGVFLSSLMLGEQLSILIFVALSLVALGIVFVNRDTSLAKDSQTNG